MGGGRNTRKEIPTNLRWYHGHWTQGQPLAGLSLRTFLETVEDSFLDPDLLEKLQFGRSPSPYEAHSSVDACLVSYMQSEALGYPYAFVDDFGAVEDIDRLDTTMVYAANRPLATAG